MIGKPRAHTREQTMLGAAAECGGAHDSIQAPGRFARSGNPQKSGIPQGDPRWPWQPAANRLGDMNDSDTSNHDTAGSHHHGESAGRTETSGESHHTQQNPLGALDRFFAWLRGLGIVRGNDRWFAGVAGGIAAKAGIDPIIVRGVFVVLAVLGGPGILLYLAAWVLLPDAEGRIHFEDLVRGRASAAVITVAVILAVVVVLPLLFWVLRSVVFTPFGLEFWGGFPTWMQVTLGVLWWGLIVPGLIIWLIYWFASGASRRDGDRAAHRQSFADQATSWGEQAGAWGQQAGEKAGAWGEEVGRKAGAWGEQVGQKASDQANQVGRTDQAAAHSRPSAAFVLLSLGIGLFAAAGAAVMSIAADFSPETTLTVSLIAGVATLAVAMIVAGIRGTDSGWVGFIAFCGVIALLFAPLSTVLPQQTEVVPLGNATLVAEAGDADRAVLTVFGNTTIDLSALNQSAQPRSIDVWMLAGNATVVLPNTAPTVVTVNMLGGNVRDERMSSEDRRQGGAFLARTVTQNAAGLSSDEVIEVRIRLLAGNAYVEGGAPIGSFAESERAELDALVEERERLQQQVAERDTLQQEIDALTKELEALENAR